jgi:hypothetical protein
MEKLRGRCKSRLSLIATGISWELGLGREGYVLQPLFRIHTLTSSAGGILNILCKDDIALVSLLPHEEN